MALVLVEGFDHFSEADANEKGWTGAIFANTDSASGFGQGIEVIANNPVSKQLPASYSEFIIGGRFRCSGGIGEFLRLIAAGTGAKVAIVALGSDHRLELSDAAGRLIATGTTVIADDSWFYLELKVVVGTSGTGELRLNGAAEIASTTGNFGTDDIDRVQFKGQSAHAISVDDVVCLDTTGSSPQNDFIGDVTVKTLYPDSDGTYTDWTPNIVGNHYTRVNETEIDGDSSFISDTVTGDKDSFLMDTLGASTVYGVQLNLGARKGDAGTRQVAPLIRQSATDHVGDTVTLSMDYLFYSWLLDDDPTGSAWTQATVNADEYGVELIA